ncbi:hypothetical protein [Desmospora activa]|uniref:hypothetical protein n=1 Tax=Desmospora activa TaxID=500615 RepID=UPI0011B24680|nr:hypothetical protein [Desmospora activa]
MGIDDLFNQLGSIPGAKTGKGPRHPTQPANEIQKSIDDFLLSYPALRNDPGYVDFLEKYAGAYIENEDQTQIVDILGFSNVSTHIIDMEGPVVNEHGFLIFAQCIYSSIHDGKLTDSYEHDFAFSVTGAEGIYWISTTLHTQNQPFIFYAENFLQWLRNLISAGGIFERPHFK